MWIWSAFRYDEKGSVYLGIRRQKCALECSEKHLKPLRPLHVLKIGLVRLSIYMGTGI